MWGGVGRCPCPSPSPRMVSSAKHYHCHSTTSAYVNVVFVLSLCFLVLLELESIDTAEKRNTNKATKRDAILSHDSSNFLSLSLSLCHTCVYPFLQFFFFHCQMVFFFFFGRRIFIRSALLV